MTRTLHGEFVLEAGGMYMDSNLRWRFRTLYFSHKNYSLLGGLEYLCDQEIDLTTGELEIKSTTKWFFYPEEEEDGHVPHFEIHYDDDGEIERCTYYDVPDPWGEGFIEKSGYNHYTPEQARVFGDSLPGFPGYFLDATFDPYQLKKPSAKQMEL
ncbi:MAG: hypothetical protein AAFQ98_15485 [Bacteroidota bacterium]